MSSSFRADSSHAQSPRDPAGVTRDEATHALRQLSGRTLATANAATSRDPAVGPSEAREAASGSSAGYGAEFWAKMSHELRSPLNSLLVLSKLLVDDADQNLSAKQLAFAQTIHNSGNDLLALISDMVDLSKLGAELLALDTSELRLECVRAQVLQTFEPLARACGLRFAVELGAGAPTSVVTDAKRLHQVLKNLILNAFDRSEQGTVTVRVGVAHFGWPQQLESLTRADEVIAFSVTDTGLCLSESERQSSFELFHEPIAANRPRARRTGLGLALSRELARRLGGELSVQSGAGGGNTFTLYLPTGARVEPPVQPHASRIAQPEPAPRGGIEEGTSAVLHPSPSSRPRVILMADPLLLEASVAPALERGFSAVSCASLLSELGTLALALPAAIALDLSQQRLGDWVALDCLVSDVTTRAVPVLAVAQLRQRALAMGAAAVAASTSPKHLAEALRELELYAPSEPRRVLLISHARDSHAGIAPLVAAEGVEVSVVASVQDALGLACRRSFHASVVHLDVADPKDSGLLRGLPELATQRAGGVARELPIIVYAERSLSAYESEQLRSCPRSAIIKSAASPERLLHEVSIYVRCPEARYSSEQRRLLALGLRRAPELMGSRVLLVDDDVRRVFALTSALERHGVAVSYADDAREVLSKLDREANLCAALVNVSASKFQGDEVIGQIRQYRVHRQLPIIALGARSPAEAARVFRVPGTTYQIDEPVEARLLISALRIVTAHG